MFSLGDFDRYEWISCRPIVFESTSEHQMALVAIAEVGANRLRVPDEQAGRVAPMALTASGMGCRRTLNAVATSVAGKFATE